MEEATVEPVKKRRGWPKGKSRGPRKPAVVAPMFTSAPEPEAPINVFVRLRNGMTTDFGCARRTVENGFHVFFYPSEKDRYRETRREFAISEIVELEITEARQVYNFVTPEKMETFGLSQVPQSQTAAVPTGPKIHSARQNANNVLQALEQSSGSIRMDKMPNLAFGDSEA